eukprot:m.195853 g.195853  ORF g.195853 m.195853 type:complete len:58 (+) comp17007_c0_seq2:2995-3168(+)
MYDHHISSCSLCQNLSFLSSGPATPPNTPIKHLLDAGLSRLQLCLDAVRSDHQTLQI